MIVSLSLFVLMLNFTLLTNGSDRHGLSKAHEPEGIHSRLGLQSVDHTCMLGVFFPT